MMDYDELAREYAAHRRVNPEVLRALVGDCGLSPASRVLEVGCGTGNYIKAVRSAVGCRCWGTDPSMEMLAKAREAPGSVNFGYGRGESIRFEDGSLDLVFSVDAIHHVEDREAFFSEAHRVLAPGGLLCTVTDSEEIIRNRIPLSSYFPDTVEPELARYPRVGDLEEELAWAGFKDLRREQVELAYDLEDLTPYRERAFSALHLIPRAAVERGLRRMELDLGVGPIPCVARYLLLWGSRGARAPTRP